MTSTLISSNPMPGNSAVITRLSSRCSISTAGDHDAAAPRLIPLSRTSGLYQISNESSRRIGRDAPEETPGPITFGNILTRSWAWRGVDTAFLAVKSQFREATMGGGTEKAAS